MHVESVKVRFDATEYQALVRSCDVDMRPVDDQVRYIAVQELRRRGLLPPPSVMKEETDAVTAER